MKHYVSILLSAVLLWGTPAVPVLAEREPETTDETTQVREEMPKTEENPTDMEEEENADPEVQESEADSDSAEVPADNEALKNDSEPQDPEEESEQFSEDSDSDSVSDTAEAQPAAETDGIETAEEDMSGELSPEDYLLSFSDEFSAAEEELLNADPSEEVKYNLWVGETQVTERNCSNILNDTGKPTASFDPVEKILTLNDPDITAVNNVGDSFIFAHEMDLTVRGTATLNANAAVNNRISDKDINGIYVRNGNLSIEGNDTVLSISASQTGVGVVDNTSPSSPSSTMTIDGANVTVNAPLGIGGICNIVLKNSIITSTGQLAGILAYSGVIQIDGGYLHAVSTYTEDNMSAFASLKEPKLEENVSIIRPEKGEVLYQGELYYIGTRDTDTMAKDVIIAQQVQATFNANYSGSPAPAVQNAIYGDETTLKPNTFTRTGYTFNGWNTKADGTGTAYADKASVKFTGNLDLFAQWKAINYTVTYNLDGGTVAKANPSAYNADTADFTLNNPTKNGYEFLGWTGSNGKTAQKTVTVKKGTTGNLSYTANWKKNPSQACKAFGFCEIDGKDYWYENSIRQGTINDPKGVIGDGTNRGREIYDPNSDAWYWLDSIYEGAKAAGKEVWIPYVYQDEVSWSDNMGRVNEVAALSYSYTEAPDGTTADMVAQIKDAILKKKGKWVRYDGNGKMMKGWVTINNGLEKYYPNQAGKTYYYDYRTGMMAKGWTKINGIFYFFDERTGELLG